MKHGSKLDIARARVAKLRARLEASEGAHVGLIETHISWVLLTRDRAYKIKKPVRFPFLDLRSLKERRRCCEEELRLNRRFAPDLYLDVVPVHVDSQGPCFGAGEPEVDFAVRMRRFADGALWSERVALGTLGVTEVESFARDLAIRHRDAANVPPGSKFGSSTARARVVEGLVEAIDRWQATLATPAAEWRLLRGWVQDEHARLESHWAERLRDGAIRECHGDQHLANVVQQGATAVAFDALEFSAELRWIDPLDDVAFLAMDLQAHKRGDLSFRLLNVYLEESGDYGAVPALRFFLVTRALVRAQVMALRASGGGIARDDLAAEAYLALASMVARGSDPRLAITHGLPGSGKTFVSTSLADDAHALRVRSDVERKRLFGLSPSQSSAGASNVYGVAANVWTYSRLLTVARTALVAGWPTIVDAAFLRRDERERFAWLAQELKVPFTILSCCGELALLRQRIESRQARGDDASEADVEVLERLIPQSEPLDECERSVAIVCDAQRLPHTADLARRWKAFDATRDRASRAASSSGPRASNAETISARPQRAPSTKRTETRAASSSQKTRLPSRQKTPQAHNEIANASGKLPKGMGSSTIKASRGHATPVKRTPRGDTRKDPRIAPGPVARTRSS